MVPELTYDKFVEILNKNIFGQEKAELIKKVASYPERYIGLFRPTTPKSKLLQNIFQSREIRFGNALEEVIREFIKSWGYQDIPDKKFTYGEEEYDLDQYFKDNGGTYYFIEQKVRDDHDSTKKRGQMENFKVKLKYLHDKHGDALVGIMYFIDPSLTKNRNYYLKELETLKRKYPNVDLHLLYGKELFRVLGNEDDWDKLLEWLKTWKQQLPEFPEIDLDVNPDESFRQIKDLELRYWDKICKHEQLWEQGIMNVISSKGIVLNMIADDLLNRPTPKAKKIGKMLKQRINKYYRN